MTTQAQSRIHWSKWRRPDYAAKWNFLLPISPKLQNLVAHRNDRGSFPPMKTGRREERLMLRYFPQEYPIYKRQVKAIVPFVV